MKPVFTIAPMRKYIRKHIISGKTEIVRVSNRNHLTSEHHQKLLNLNDEEYEYIYVEECQDNFIGYSKILVGK